MLRPTFFKIFQTVLMNQYLSSCGTYAQYFLSLLWHVGVINVIHILYAFIALNTWQ